MKDAILNDIKEYAIRKLKHKYDFCGVAEGDTCVLINSTNADGDDIKIKIEVEPS